MSFISSIPDVAVVVVIFKELVGGVQDVEDVQVDVVGDVQADAQVVLGVQEVVVVDVEVKR